MAANRAAFVVQVGEPRPATSAKPSASAVYRHTLAKDGFPTIEASTLYELFARSVHKYGPNPCLGRRPIQDDGTAGPYTFKTYAEVGEQVADLGAGLKVLGVGAGKRVGVFGTNCPEWMTAMQACNRMSTVCVPLYDSLGENAIEYIVRHSDAVVVFAATEKLPQLLKGLSKSKGAVTAVVYWGRGDDEAAKGIKSLGCKVLSLEELGEMGRRSPSDAVPPTPDDLCTIMYTSGTTGCPGRPDG